MTDNDITQRKIFLKMDEADEDRLAGMRPLTQEHISGILDGFYDHMRAMPQTSELLRDPEQVRRLKKIQRRYFLELTEGEYDAHYEEKRIRIGRTHERIGLSPQWYMGAYSVFLNELIAQLFAARSSDPEALQADIQSLVKVIFLDMGLAVEAYTNTQEKALKARFIGNLERFSGRLGESTSGIVTASTQLSAAAAEQAATVSEVTATVSEIRSTSQQSLETAESVIQTAEGAMEVSSRGIGVVEQSLGAMNEIQVQMGSIADKILDLSEHTQQIGEIIATVKEIAEQSKLLALNASIEAARAGEHGRGFSVVASEIRTLADQSKQATRQVVRILGEIQKATNAAVIATEAGSKKVDAGLDLAERAGQDIRELADVISEAADSARLIASSTMQLNSGFSQVAEAMHEINQATTQTASGLREAEGAARNLDGMSDEIDTLLQQFSNGDRR